MLAKFGTYEYSNIAGYLIHTGLLPRNGIAEHFAVFVLLEFGIDTLLPPLPCWDEKLKTNTPLKDELKLTRGEAVSYSFPDIHFKSARVFYNNSLQYYALEFVYPDGLTPGVGKKPPNISISNNDAPRLDANASKSRGTIAVNKEGGNAAQLVGVQAYQVQERDSGLQMLNERCQLAGWLQPILEQNTQLNAQKIPDCALEFKLNSSEYSCLPSAQGLKYLLFEERYKLALDLPLHPIDQLAEQDTPAVGRVPFESLSRGFSARDMLKSWGAGARIGYTDMAVEICSVVSGRAEARLFDWRTPKQKETATADPAA